MDYEQACADLRDRLIALVDNPPYRFRDTTRAEAEAYQARRRAFHGNTADEIDKTECLLGVRFPLSLRAYFGVMGEAAGDLFRGSDRARLSRLSSYHVDANSLFEECTGARLPDEAIVFFFHQGYTFSYQFGVLPTSGTPVPDDGPVFAYVEGKKVPQQASPGLIAYLEAEVAQQEDVCRRFHEQGGYYVTVQNGRLHERYPALSTRPRPLETPDQFVD